MHANMQLWVSFLEKENARPGQPLFKRKSDRQLIMLRLELPFSIYFSRESHCDGKISGSIRSSY